MATRRDPPPTTRQVFALCRELLEESGRPWPGTRAEASAMIARLRERRAAAGATVGRR
ncbi:MAG TPA: hypothetical protein VNB64_08040 [Solirubrobacteraceae bacterium]|nr:hypothetical protein [Solirubrobacteraceae bacterium]